MGIFSRFFVNQSNTPFDLTSALNEFFLSTGINSLVSSKQLELKNKIIEVVTQGVLIRVMEKMKDSDIKKLNELIEADPVSHEKITMFIRSKVRCYDKIMQEEFENIKNKASFLLKAAMAE